MSAQPEDGSTQNRVISNLGFTVRNIGSEIGQCAAGLSGTGDSNFDSPKEYLARLVAAQKELTAAIAALRKLAK